MRHETYVIEQPFGGRGKAWQAVCHRCGVLLHINDRAAVENEARSHGMLMSDNEEEPLPPLTPDEIADAIHDAKMRQRKIEAELA